MATKNEITVIESLSVVRVQGFEVSKSEEIEGMVDQPGSANAFCEEFGMAALDEDSLAGPGILWTDYDGSDWEFAVLISTEEVDALKAIAEETGYEILSVKEITEPTNFGDGGGTVEILKHRDGWVVLS